MLPRDKGAEWRVYYGDKPANADLSEPLSVLWGMPEILPALRAHFGHECQSGVTAAPADGIDLGADADAPPELLAIAREQRAARANGPAAPLTAGELVNRLPSLNGTHKPGS